MLLKKEITLLLLLFWGIIGTTKAQNFTISGYLKDSANGEDLIGATVQIDRLNIGTVTNVYGFYSLEVPTGAYQLSASYVGYEVLQQSLNVASNLKLDLRLTPAATQLEEVVVSSVAKDKNIRSTQMGIEKLNIETIKKVPIILGEPDILRTILLLPGVSNNSEASTGFNVRGGSGDQNLILLDEATIYNPSHLLGFFSVFNADAIKDVQLYKGGIPARYGGRLSSVLDVRQKEGNRKKFQGKAGIGLIASKLSLEGPLGNKENGEAKGSWLLAGRRSYADVFLRLSSDFQNDQLYFYDLNAKANYNLSSSDRLFISGYFGRDRLELGSVLGLQWGNRSFTARWNHLFGNRLFGNLSITNSLYDYAIKSQRPGTQYQWTSEISNTSARKNFNFFLNNKNEINFGVEGNYSIYRPGKIRQINDSNIQPIDFDEKYSLELGAYLSNDQQLTDWLAINYGLRYSLFQRRGKETILTYENDLPVVQTETGAYVEGKVIGATEYQQGNNIRTFTGLEPRFSARVSLNNQSSIKLGYNRMYQYIHLISNSTSATPIDIWSPSGPFKSPQRADQFAIGYFQNFKDNQYELSVEGFYKKMDKVIDFIDGAELVYNNNLETELLSGQGRAYGIELLLRKNVGRFNGWLSYTLSRSERQIDGINLGEYYPANQDKTHDLSITGIYDISKRFGVSANFIFATGRPVTYPAGRYEYSGLVLADYSRRNLDRLPAYHRFDVSAILKNKPSRRRESQWVFSVYNAYNRLNASSINFREQSQGTGRGDIATGISEAVKLSYFGIVPSVSYEIKF